MLQVPLRLVKRLLSKMFHKYPKNPCKTDLFFSVTLWKTNKKAEPQNKFKIKKNLGLPPKPNQEKIKQIKLLKHIM